MNRYDIEIQPFAPLIKIRPSKAQLRKQLRHPDKRNEWKPGISYSIENAINYGDNFIERSFTHTSHMQHGTSHALVSTVSVNGISRVL